MKPYFLFLSLLLSGCYFIPSAQALTISGKVIDQSRDLIVGQTCDHQATIRFAMLLLRLIKPIDDPILQIMIAL